MLKESEKSGVREMLKLLRGYVVRKLAKTMSESKIVFKTHEGKCNDLFK